MKIIALNGSPRKNGNSSAVIKNIFQYLESEGMECEEINLCQEKIQPCIACYGCFENKNRECNIKKDGLNRIIAKMSEAAGIILVSPVYTASVTGWMKAFMERASLVSMANNGLYDRKPAIAISIARRAGTMSAMEPMLHFIHITGMISIGSTYWNVAFGASPEEVLKDTEGMETLNNAAKNFSWLVKSLDLAAGTIPVPETQRTTAMNFIR